jgi:hypothetical protein
VGVGFGIIDCVEKNLHRLATAPSFYTRILLWLITARPRADTVPNMPNDSTTERYNKSDDRKVNIKRAAT